MSKQRYEIMGLRNYDRMKQLLSHVNKTDNCWIWVGGRFSNGYGHLMVSGQIRLAHRQSYELHIGPIPDGLVIDHLCRVRHCVNPEHLEPVTNRENLLRGVGFSAENARRTHCVNGHPFDHPNTWIDPRSGGRSCRACDRKRALRRYHEKKAQIPVEEAEAARNGAGA